MKILFSLILVASLASCDYSPLDSHIEAVNASVKANDSARIEACKYIDSLTKDINN